MQVEVVFKFDEKEEQIIKLLDQLYAAQYATNACGEDEWRWLADGFTPDGQAGVDNATDIIKYYAGAYWVIDQVQKRIALQLFDGNDEMVEHLYECVVDSGEPPSYHLKHNAKSILRGLGTHYGAW